MGRRQEESRRRRNGGGGFRPTTRPPSTRGPGLRAAGESNACPEDTTNTNTSCAYSDLFALAGKYATNAGVDITTVLYSREANGNSLRALVKHLDGISDGDIAELNLPTGTAIVYGLDDQLRPTESKHPLERCLGDPEAVKAAAAAVAAQTAAR